MPQNKKNILVTGAAGLIGSAITKLLIDKGYRVIACDNFSIGAWQETHERITWENQDFSTESGMNALKKHHIDTLIHCAAHPGGKSLEEPSINVRVNALGSMQLFEWCSQIKARVIYTSSCMVYGNQPGIKTNESAPLAPGTIYAVNKIACENYLRILGEGHGLKWSVARLFATYGAGHKPSGHQGIVNVMLTQLMQGNKIISRGNLGRVRDLIYVDDVALAIVAILESDKTENKILNIGTGTPVTIGKMIKTLIKVMNRNESDILIEEAAGTVGDPDYTVADITLLNQLTGFTPKFDIHAGLTKLIQLRNQVKSS